MSTGNSPAAVSNYLIPARGLKQPVANDVAAILGVSNYLIPARGLKHINLIILYPSVENPSF